MHEMSKLKEITREGKIKKIGGNPSASCFKAIHHNRVGIQ
jgi:hypothetical protein